VPVSLPAPPLEQAQQQPLALRQAQAPPVP